MSNEKEISLYQEYLKLSLEDLKRLAVESKKEEIYFYSALLSLRMENEWDKAFGE